MTIQACYEQLGGDYDEVLDRLPSDELIRCFVKSFLDDPSYETLCAAFAAENRVGAFHAAHSLKGICGSLGFERLFASVDRLTETLRGGDDAIPEDAPRQLDVVSRDYREAVAAIRAYVESGE